MAPELDSFSSTWQRAVAEHGDATFLIFGSDDGVNTRWTYAQFDDVVAHVAGTLRDAGVRPGSSVHLVLRNCPAFVAVWLAVARLGAWMVPVDPASAARDISSQVGRVEPRVSIIAASRTRAHREGAADRAGVVFAVAEDASDLLAGAPLLAGPPVPEAHPVGPFDRLAVMFTSGTTSEPKGVELTQACYATVAATMAQVVGLQPRHRWFVTLPLFHANAQYYCFAPAMAVGASVALTGSFSASRWVPKARELEVTHASLFAAPIRMILARCPSGEEPLGLEHVWFAQNLGADHHKEFGDLVGTLPRQLYGMTETVAVVTADRSEPPVHDVIGPPVAGRRVRVVDPVTGEDAAPGHPGELFLFGVPGRDLFAGYLNAPDVTARALLPAGDGAWFRTGDLVTRGADGALRFVGRVDDVIKVSGENVSLTEVEAAVAQAPGVLEVAVVAQPDPVRDQVPVAYVVAKDKANPPTADQLDAWAVGNLAPAARPRAWHLIDELPRTSVGKVRRFRVAN
jgi:crotonobetaine/carnitine-CoA ligase